MSACASDAAKMSVLPGSAGSMWRASCSHITRVKGSVTTRRFEALHLEAEIVRRCREIDRASQRVEQRQLATFKEMNAVA